MRTDSRKYIVFIVEYHEKSERNIENLLRSIEEPINREHGKTKRVYQGSEHRVISALESILKLTE